MKLTKEEKETIIKLDSLDIKTKQELIRHDAKELFWSNDEDVSAMNSLLDKLFIINKASEYCIINTRFRR